MNSIRAGRIIGALILLQMIAGILVNFGLESPLFGSPGFLQAAAAHARQLGFAVLLSLLVEGSWAAIAITALPALRRRTPALALWLVVLAGVVLAAAVAENAAVLSMVSVSEAYAKADAAGRGQFEALRVIVASARNWPHILARMLDGVTILAFNIALYRSALVPRVIAAAGAIAALSQIAGVTLPLFGHDVVFPMLAPLALTQLALASWLMLKGFAPQPAVKAGK